MDRRSRLLCFFVLFSSFILPASVNALSRDLIPAERFVIDKVREGETADLGLCPDGYSIGADFLKEILTGSLQDLEVTEKGISISGAQIEGALAITEERIPFPIYLGSCAFDGKIDLYKTTFSEKANFWEATFGDVASFHQVVFNGVAYFGEAKFSKSADFGGARFSGAADFELAKFLGSANFEQANFCETAKFSEAQFSHEADFGGAEFSQKAVFSGAKFSGMAIFSDTKFVGEANFPYVNFSGVTYFSAANFYNRALFTSSDFSSPAYFSAAEFSNDAVFSKVKFFDEAHYFKTQFSGEADFGGSEFSQKASFSSAQFSQKASFIKADVHNADLSGVDLNEADLTESDLSEADLTETDLSNCRLYRVKLPPIYEPKSGSPYVPSIATCPKLSNLTFKESPHGLVDLREGFKKMGYRRQERDITYAIMRTQRCELWNFPEKLKNVGHKGVKADSRKSTGIFRQVEGMFYYLFFEVTCQYGRKPGRPLLLLLALIPFFAVFYILALRSKRPKTGIWQVLPEERILKTREKEPPFKLTSDLPPGVTSASRTKRIKLKARRLGRMVWVSLYFSLLSATSIGWRDFNVGSWISRLQRREYVLRATGWVRFVSGLQSLISVYLLALWVLTYFGRPFEAL